MNTISAPELRGVSEPARVNYATTPTGIVIGCSWLPRHSADYATPIRHTRRAGVMGRWLILGAVLSALAVFVSYHDAPPDTQELADMQADLTDAQAAAVVAALGRK